MKKIIQLYFLTIAATALVACGGGTDPVKDAKKENSEKIDSQLQAKQRNDSLAMSVLPSKDDANFMVNAASGGMFEVQLGQLAQTHAKNMRVKNFGEMMVKDHSEGGEKLKALAVGKGIILPDSISRQQQKEKNRLQKMKGS